MLSICIPLYNTDASKLVHSLRNQCIKEKITYEIILIDDCSPIQFSENAILNKLNSVQYILLNKNVGRAKIRNLFLDYVTFENMLFIDGDLAVHSIHFINKYVSEITNSLEVICGGITYTKTPPSTNKLLRWKNTKQKESSSVELRSKNSYGSFMTGCFLIKTSILKQVKFNENIKGYGHEDTLFGYDLMVKKIHIKHINNPILVDSYDTNISFIQKTEQAIKNLNTVLTITNFDNRLINSITLLNTLQKYSFLQSCFFKTISFITTPVLRKICSYGNSPLLLFDLLKLSLAIRNVKLK